MIFSFSPLAVAAAVVVVLAVTVVLAVVVVVVRSICVRLEKLCEDLCNK